MNNQKSILRYVVGLLCFFTLACTREAESTSTKIAIQLPTASTFASKDANTVTTSSSSEWSTVVPEQVGSFNCFLVLVSGPEEILQRNSCGKRITNGSDDFTPSIYFGPIEGGYYSGSSLEIEVASGTNRVIMLAGFVADSAAACQQYSSADFDKTHLSKPYLIGKSAPTNLSPTVGTDAVSIPITMALDQNAYFEECAGPAFNKGNGTAVATKVRFRKDLFPTDMTVENSCNSFEVELKTAQGNNANAAANSTFGLKMNGTYTATYNSYYDCSQTTGAVSQFTIPNTQQASQRWVKTPALSTATLLFVLDILNPALTPEYSGNQYVFSNKVYTTAHLDLTGPAAVVGEYCYNYDISLRKIDGSYLVGDGSHVLLNAPGALSVYSGANCVGVVTPSNSVYDIVLDNTGTNTKTISMKFNLQAIRYDSTITLYSSGGGGALTNLTTTVYTNAIGTTISKLNILEDRVLPRSIYKCYGPFRLATTNVYNVELPVSTATTIAMVQEIPNATIRTSCNGTDVNSLSIPAGNSSVNFYVYSSSTAASSGQITFTEPTGVLAGGTLKYVFQIYFN